MVAAPVRDEVRLNLTLRGGNREIFAAREAEVVAEGPAGTGKTRTWLELINLLCHTFAGLRVLMLREVQLTMAASCIAEFQKHVLHPEDGVTFFGGSKSEPAAFRYDNGSLVAVAGMDNPEKVLSSFWDLIYFNEANQTTLEKWETLTTRLRAPEETHLARRADGVPFTHRRLCGDLNPTYGSHWLHQRCDHGTTRVIHSRLEDNPAYYNDDGSMTEAGADYVQRLDRLTGIRYERFRLGKRVGVQDAIYPAFNRDFHVRALEDGLFFKTTIIGEDYGTDHLCAVVALSIDQYNRRWVREAWAQADKDQGTSLNRVVSEFKERYQTRRGRVDPNQGFLAGQHGFSIAKGGNGGASGPPRLHRIDLMERLFYTFSGGWVPSFAEDKALVAPLPAFVGGDTPGFFLVEGAPGIDELADEIEAYHYVWAETPKGKSKDVYRVNDNRLAAVEYANEEWEENPAHVLLPPSAIAPSYGFAPAPNERRFSTPSQGRQPTVVRLG